MTVARKDSKGRALRKGECYRPSDNRYVFTYTDRNSKRHYVYACDLSQLREKEDKLKRDQLDGIKTDLAKITVNEQFDKYMETKINIRRSTNGNYIYMYDAFVRPKFGMRKIGDVTYSDVLALYKELLVDRGMQSNTARTINGVLQAVFERAVRDDIIRKNPVRGALKEMTSKVGAKNGVRHALTAEQQKAFMGFIKGHPVYDHWRTVFTVLLGTGMRCGEFIALRWQDIDMQNKMISVNHSLVRISVKPGGRARRLGLSLPKTDAGFRTIPMMDKVYDAFQEEYDRQSETGFNETIIEGMSGFIFQNANGTVLCEQNINSAIRRIVVDYNYEEKTKAAKEKREPVLLPYFSCHCLRHTFCTRLCENGVNIKVIQSVMGHRNIKTTLGIYAEVSERVKQQSIDALSLKMEGF